MKHVHVPVVYFGQQQTYTCRNTVLACCRPRLWQSWHYLLVCSCFTTKPAGDLVVSSTILETRWWKLWYVLCLPTNLTHIAGCHPTKTCPYQLIMGCVLTLAHNNMAFWTSLVEMGMFVTHTASPHLCTCVFLQPMNLPAYVCCINACWPVLYKMSTKLTYMYVNSARKTTQLHNCIDTSGL